MRGWQLAIPLLLLVAARIRARLARPRPRRSPPHAGAASKGPPTAAWIAFVALYLGMCGWFASVDVYRDHFYESRPALYIPYSLFRLLWIGYLGAILCGLGGLVVAAVERRRGGASRFGGPGGLRLSALDRSLLAFFLGSALLHLLFQPLGFANLYTRGVALALALPLVVVSFPGLYALWRQRRSLAPRLLARADDPLGPRWSESLRALTLAAALLGLAHVTLFKGLQPHATGDVATHYFPYLRRVIESGNLWPNEVWYHFYHSKGASAVFLSLLQTDLIGAQLATTTYLLASCGALLSLVRQATGSTAWGLAATTVYATALVDQWQWASFEKHHVMSMTLLAGLVWSVVRLETSPARERAFWTACVALVFVNLVLFASIAVFPFAAILVGVLGLAALLRGNPAGFGRYLLAGLAGSAALLVNLALNQGITGLAEMTPFRVFWELADQERFSSWASPYVMLLMIEGSEPGLGGIAAIDLDGSAWNYWFEAFRLKSLRIFYAFLPPAGVFVLLAAGLATEWRRRSARPAAAVVIAPVAVVAASALVLGQFMNQPISMHRFFVFTLFLGSVALPVAWSPIVRAVREPRLRYSLLVIVPAVVASVAFLGEVKDLSRRRARTGMAFVAGQISYAEAYASDLALWPPARPIAEHLGPEARIWSLNGPWHSSMAPGPRLEGFLSYGMSRDYPTVLFEAPDLARARLREAGLDYFLVDASLPLFDVLPHAPLFRPETLARWFEPVWHDGDVTVLGWREDDAAPLPEGFVARYREMIAKAQIGADWRGLHARLESIYRRSKGQLPAQRDPDAPPIRGFQ